MTVGELLEMLEGEDPSREIRIISGGKYPVNHDINTVVRHSEEEEEGEEPEVILYIVEGKWMGYGPTADEVLDME